MATTKEYRDFILEQLNLLDNMGINYRYYIDFHKLSKGVI